MNAYSIYKIYIHFNIEGRSQFSPFGEDRLGVMNRRNMAGSVYSMVDALRMTIYITN